MAGNQIKIAVAHFVHETVTFLKSDTVLGDFIYEGSPLTGAALLDAGKGSYLEGFTKVAREYQDVELVGITSPMFPKTGTGSGWIRREAYEWFVGRMLEEIAAAGALDGVYLALHGAMAVQGVSRPEVELARRIREIVGPKVPIAATFDPHGNQGAAFFRCADLAFSSKYYPHYDEYLQGARAARTLVRSIRGDYQACHATCKVPVLSPTVMQCTNSGPWLELVNQALLWEARHPDLYLNVFFGFPWSDVADNGLAIQATTNQQPDLARQAAIAMASHAWHRRHELVRATDVRTIREGVALAASLESRTPIIVADHSDRSGRATWVLAEVIRQGLSRTLIATLTDSSLFMRLSQQNINVGDDVEIDVGGGPDSSDGAPIRITGRIGNIADMTAADRSGNTPWIVIEFGDQDMLVVTPYLTEIREPDVLRSHLGIDLARFRIIVLKSRVHFRRGFLDSGFSETAIVVEPDQPFLGTTHLDALPYENLALSEFYPYGRDAFQPELGIEISFTEERMRSRRP